jgi:hypothetical protein
MNERTFEFFTGPDMTSPVDHYVQHLVDAGVSIPWEPIPDGEPGTPGFRFHDTERNLVATLTCEAQTEEYFQYRLEARKPDGRLEMRSIEWIAAGSTDQLHELYTMLQRATASYQEASTNQYNPAEEMLTEQFIAALLHDVRSKNPELRYARRGDAFVSEDFGIGENRVILKQEWEENGSDQYSIKLLQGDGSLILSCAETCKLTDPTAELRQLYQLVESLEPLCEISTGQKDAHRFIERKAYEALLTSLLEHKAPAPDNSAVPDDKCLLVSDIFREVPMRHTVQLFLDEIALLKGPLDEEKRKQLRNLAESTINMMCSLDRKTNGLRFSGATASDEIIKVANSLTSWHIDVFGEKPITSHKNVLLRVAILILAALLADQIP